MSPKPIVRKSLVRQACSDLFGLTIISLGVWLVLLVPFVRYFMLILLVALYGAMVMTMVVHAYSAELVRKAIRQDLERGESGHGLLVTNPAAFCLSFGFLCYAIDLCFPQAFFQGGGGLIDWLVYLADNLGRVLLLDFLETFYISLSPIRHQPSLWPCLLVFSFRLVLSVAVIRLVLSAAKFLRERNDAAPDGSHIP